MRPAVGRSRPLLDPPVRIRVPTALNSCCSDHCILGARRAEHAGVPRLPSNISGEEPPTVPVEPSLVGELVVKVEWFDLLFGSRGHPDQPQPGLWRDNKADRQGARDEGTFRTLCVRLCDGFHFPISCRTPRAKLGRDAKSSEHSCPHRHGYSSHRNPDQTVDDLVDIERRAYRNLPTALLYRSRYIADCTCRGNPWTRYQLPDTVLMRNCTSKRFLTKRQQRCHP